MGFLKRILSLGSKKSKKKHSRSAHNVLVDEVGLPPLVNDEDDSERAANLLLRSSSARYAVVAETDYSALPPLPHPINSLSTPSASTTSLASTSISRSYTVKVHPRQQHTCTEFPMANGNLGDELRTPRPRRRVHAEGNDSNHLQGLRRDPSVASLLDLYDEHGHLPSKAFSNTPPSSQDGHAQKPRNGSTLRELLGEPDHSHRHPSGSSLEGDISWAERFLGEASSAASSMSSLVLQTPNNFGFGFPDTHSLSHAQHETTLLDDHDLSSSFLDNPAIDSMEVELSISTDSPIIIDSPRIPENPFVEHDPKTPRRASEVFGFLTEKRKSRPPEEVLDRALPELPSAFSSPSDKDSNEGPLRSRFSSDCSSESEILQHAFAIPSSCDTPAHHRSNAVSRILFDERPSSHISHQTPSESSCIDNYSASQWSSAEPSSGISSSSNIDESIQKSGLNGFTTPSGAAQLSREVKVILTAPTKVIVTAPTPSADGVQPSQSRIPRGPRSLHRPRSPKDVRPGLMDRSNSTSSIPSDPFTPAPSRSRKNRHSSASSTSLFDVEAHTSKLADSDKAAKSRTRRQGSTKSLMATLDKENSTGLTATSELPFTPIRSNSSRSLLRAAVSPASYRPPVGMTPSPASSSELSPVAQKMMLDVRRQRSKVRESRKGSHKRHHPSERMF